MNESVWLLEYLNLRNAEWTTKWLQEPQRHRTLYEGIAFLSAHASDVLDWRIRHIETGEVIPGALFVSFYE